MPLGRDARWLDRFRLLRTDNAGFITAFDVDDAYLRRFEVQTVGARMHKELWVPAEELDEFNSHIVGRIEILEFYVGPEFAGTIDPETRMPVGWSELLFPT